MPEIHAKRDELKFKLGRAVGLASAELGKRIASPLFAAERLGRATKDAYTKGTMPRPQRVLSDAMEVASPGVLTAKPKAATAGFFAGHGANMSDRAKEFLNKADMDLRNMFRRNRLDTAAQKADMKYQQNSKAGVVHHPDLDATYLWLRENKAANIPRLSHAADMNKSLRAPDALGGTDMFKAYPHLADYTVTPYRDKSTTVAGSLNPVVKDVKVNLAHPSLKQNEDITSTLMHEFTHALGHSVEPGLGLGSNMRYAGEKLNKLVHEAQHLKLYGKKGKPTDNAVENIGILSPQTDLTHQFYLRDPGESMARLAGAATKGDISRFATGSTAKPRPHQFLQNEIEKNLPFISSDELRKLKEYGLF